MERFCTILWELIITAAMFAVPILCACSIAFGWDWSSFFVFLAIIDYLAFFGCVSNFIDV